MTVRRKGTDSERKTGRAENSRAFRMKRRSIADLELSSDEDVWATHSFKFSRVIDNGGTATSRPRSIPPPIESFAYSDGNSRNNSSHQLSNCSKFSSIEIIESSSEENIENLEDDDADVELINRNNARTAGGNRCRRFVIDDDEEEEETGSKNDFSDLEEEEEEEKDVVKKALQKCGRISAELKEELYGTAGAACDTYSVVDINSSVRIVTQVSNFFLFFLFFFLILKYLLLNIQNMLSV